MGTSANTRLEAAMTYFKVTYRHQSRDTGNKKTHTHTQTG